MYHNRLRPLEFVKLFRQAGAHIIWESRSLDHRSLEQLKDGFPIHERFQSFPNDELAVGAMQIMGTFPGQATEPLEADTPHPVEVKYRK